MQLKLNAILVDDETRARSVLRGMLEKYTEGVAVLGEAGGIDAAIPMIRNLQPDLVFLDVKMPGKDGFVLFNSPDLPPFAVIFTSAYSEYAIRAMRADAIDYLIKPIDAEELQGAIDRVRTRKVADDTPSPPTVELPPRPQPTFSKVVIPTQKGYVLQDPSQVLRVEAAGNYAIVHLRDGRQLVATRSLKHFEQLFYEQFFQRVHHKDLVNLHHVEEVNSRESYLRLTGGMQVWISIRKKAALLRRLKGL